MISDLTCLNMKPSLVPVWLVALVVCFNEIAAGQSSVKRFSENDNKHVISPAASQGVAHSSRAVSARSNSNR